MPKSKVSDQLLNEAWDKSIYRQRTHISDKQNSWLGLLRFEILIYFPLFWLLSIILPFTTVIDCTDGHLWASHITLSLLAILIFLFDLYLARKRPNKAAPPAARRSCLGKIVRIFKFEWIRWLIFELSSFIAHLDIYTDLCFISILFVSDLQSMFILSFFFFCINCLPKFIGFVIYMYQFLKGNLLEGSGLTSELDLIQNFELKGLAFLYMHSIGSPEFTNSLKFIVIMNIWKMVSEDLPQFCIQLYYLLNSDAMCDGESANFIIYVSLVVSLIASFGGLCNAGYEFYTIYSKRKMINLLNQEHTKLENKQEITEDEGKFLFRYLQRNKHMKSISFANSSLNEKVFRDICEALKVNQCLTSINFCNTKLEDSCMEYIKNAMENNTTMRFLNLSSNKFGQEGLQQILDGIWVNTTIIEASLRDNNIDDEGAKLIADSLQINHRTLRSLDLSDNKLGDKGIKMLEPVFENLFLRKLHLGGNGLTTKGLDILSQALSANHKLKWLNLTDDNQYMNEEEGRKIVAILRANHCITHMKALLNGDHKTVDLINTNIELLLHANLVFEKLEKGMQMKDMNKQGDDEICELAKTLKMNKNNLTKIQLRNKGLLKNEIKLLCLVLKANVHVTFLDLSENILDQSSQGTINKPKKNPQNNRFNSYVSQYLFPKNKILIEVHLDNCNILDITGEEIFWALKGNKTIKILTLNDNKLGEKTGRCIANFVSENRSIVTLAVNRNEIPESCAALILNGIKNNRIIKKLYIKENKISPATKELADVYMKVVLFQLKLIYL